MELRTFKTRRVIPPKDPIEDILSSIAPFIKERSIVAIASKIVSIHEGNTIAMDKVLNKDNLIMSEANMYLPREVTPGGWVMHTIKNNLLIPTAGIDESNAGSYYILWPRNPKNSVRAIWKYLKKIRGISNFGVIITDSHSIPLRRGVVGISLASFGFNSLYDYRGEKDIFGRILKVSQTNISDSLASAAVLAMGEGNEQTPICILYDVPQKVEFSNAKPESSKPFSSFEVPLNEDLYSPFLLSVPWEKGGSS